MSIVFLLCLFAGLGLAVGSMFFGVERRRPAPQMPSTVVAFVDAVTEAAGQQISARYQLPVLAAFTWFFGAVGYLLTRYTGLGILLRLIIATGAGAAATVGVVLLIAKWAIPRAREEVVDARYLLQGHIARVRRAIGATEAGEIEYEVDGVRFRLPARSVDDASVEPNTEVVIERIEDGRAYVEPWVHVEKRL
jgi:membrane protein implicated in regulation of membrane protease activity